MNEIYHIPISEADEEAPSPASEWDGLKDEFPDDDFVRKTQEIAERNTYDIPESRQEKSEAERRYETKEKDLIYELEHTADRDARYLFDAGDEYSKIFKQFHNPNAKKVEDSFDSLTNLSKNNNREVLESLMSYVDARYPSPYKQENQGVLTNPFSNELENGARKIEDLKDDYRRAVLKGSGMSADVIEDLSKIFTVDGSQNDYYVGNTLRTLGNSRADAEVAFSNALIDYIEEPSEDNKSRLRRLQGDREGVLTNGLFNTAGTFDESRTRFGSKLFEPTIALATQLVRNSEDHFDNLIDYIQFKIGDYAPKTSEKDNKILPDVVLY
ncbi:MAG: hypothetical protein Q4E70_02380 [Candidatus Saccharibacteria bacterium]|nr:hypothetical protein [Candidatus Saccharibacteria bacterium]